jgi:hypothetical protein
MMPDLRFDVLRNNSGIGRHIIKFREEGRDLIANIAVEITVGFGPITLYRYKHKVRESWRDGAFLGLESETDDNGKHYRVSAARTEDHVVVKSSGVRQAILRPEAIPLTHWNKLCIERPLFNPQSGAIMTPGVRAHGEETVPLGDGRKVRAVRYSFMLQPALDDWYDSAGHWTALRTKGWDGSVIAYRRAA